MEEIDVFHTKVVQDIVNFWWYSFAKRTATIGFINHCFFVLILNIYVYQAYMKPRDLEALTPLIVCLIISIVYPAVYETVQMVMDGFEYFTEAWNQIQLLNIAVQIANIALAIELGPQHHATVFVVIALVFMVILNTFMYLRIVPALTPIVVMLSHVIYDLKAFLLFFIIKLIMFG